MVKPNRCVHIWTSSSTWWCFGAEWIWRHRQIKTCIACWCWPRPTLRYILVTWRRISDIRRKNFVVSRCISVSSLASCSINSNIISEGAKTSCAYIEDKDYPESIFGNRKRTLLTHVVLSLLQISIRTYYRHAHWQLTTPRTKARKKQESCWRPKPLREKMR